jgi:hypothetical protein
MKQFTSGRQCKQSQRRSARSAKLDLHCAMASSSAEAHGGRPRGKALGGKRFICGGRRHRVLGQTVLPQGTGDSLRLFPTHGKKIRFSNNGGSLIASHWPLAVDRDVREGSGSTRLSVVAPRSIRSSLAPHVGHIKKRKACVSADAGVSRLSSMIEPQNAQTTSPVSSIKC